jgi:hypothetical protein
MSRRQIADRHVGEQLGVIGAGPCRPGLHFARTRADVSMPAHLAGRRKPAGE